jgi:4-alpha-glucanotransferase
LGEITPDVEALRDQFEFPGMKVLQFAFDSGADNPFLPFNYPRNCVVYTGTHETKELRDRLKSMTEIYGRTLTHSSLQV